MVEQQGCWLYNRADACEMPVNNRAGDCTTGLVVVQQGWWLYSRAGGCTAGLVVEQQGWWLNNRAVGCTTGLMPVSCQSHG